MKGINKVILVGHCGKDPEVITTNEGMAIANFSVATNNFVKDKNSNQNIQQTEWHRCKAFGKVAEILQQWVKKGMPLYVEGVLKTRKWTDKTGIERYTTEIIVNQLQMLGSKKDGENMENDVDSTPSNHDNFDDDIPW